jgi:hypothetical protein
MATNIKIRPDGLYEIVHAPGAILDYAFNWAEWLQQGETILTSAWSITPSLTLNNEQNQSGVTSVFVNGGVVNKIYYLTNTITTSVGRTDSRTIVLSCQNKGYN